MHTADHAYTLYDEVEILKSATKQTIFTKLASNITLILAGGPSVLVMVHVCLPVLNLS